jgi:hypothetical protein
LAWTAAADKKVDQTVVVGTDGASYFLFHPEDLAHRRSSPGGWTADDFACGAEFVAGNLVAIDTGGDGAAPIRVTNGALTPREKARVSGSWPFRYRVRHGRVLLDGGLHVPHDTASKDQPPEDHWVAIPNGNYQVTVYAINRTIRDAGGAGLDFDKTLPEYVFQFRPVPRLDPIKVRSKTSPRLIPGEPAVAPNEKPPWVSLLDDTSKPLRRSYLAVVKEGSPVTPGTYDHFELSEAAYHATSEAKEFVIVSGKVPGVAVLVRSTGGGSSDGKWDEVAQGVRLVRVTALEQGDPVPKVSVAPLNRPTARMAPKDVAALKAAFATYAKTDAEFRKSERNPDYQAERAVAIESPTALTNLLLHLVRMPPEERAKLLPLSDAGRIRGLRARLESTPPDGERRP